MERSPSGRHGLRRMLASDRRALRRFIYDRDNGMCMICHTPVDFSEMQIDHKVPVSRGGSNARSNLQASHPLCNKAKGTAY